MVYANGDKFDLTKLRPQVLLMGNGLVRNNGFSWEEFIEKTKDVEFGINRYKKEPDKPCQIPNTILAEIMITCDDKKRQNEYQKRLKKGVKYSKNERICEIIKIPFDSILTTNYTYELEYAFDASYPSSDGKQPKYAYCTRKPHESNALLRTYNKMKIDSPPIWHIHGEQRVKSSLVLSHNEYAKLVKKIDEYCSSSPKKNFDNMTFKSWIEYFLYGDVYIIGSGFDFAEFDLWWLLCKRKREISSRNFGSQIYFYAREQLGENTKESTEENSEENTEENSENKYKFRALKDMGVNVICLKHNEYDEFYKEAIQDIEKKVMTQKRSEDLVCV
jgi:hypothetical protein